MTAFKGNYYRKTWILNPMIDDSYKKDPPSKYAFISKTELVLIYDANSIGKRYTVENPAAAAACLAKVIGDWVYTTCPTSKDRKNASDKTANSPNKVVEIKRRENAIRRGIVIVYFNEGKRYRLIEMD